MVCSLRVVVVHNGRSILDEPIAALRQRSRQVRKLRVRTMDDAVDDLRAALQASDAVTRVEMDSEGLIVEVADGHRDDVIQLAREHGGLRELVEERRSLEEVFRDLIAEPQETPA